MISIKVKRLTPTAKLPVRGHETDTGYDVFADKVDDQLSYKNHQLKVHTGLAIQPERGYYIEVFPRSSISKKFMQLANSVAVIDEGYTGEVILVFNILPIGVTPYGNLSYSSDSVIKPGEKIAQFVVRKREDAEFYETIDDFVETTRGAGGFGSTGV